MFRFLVFVQLAVLVSSRKRFPFKEVRKMNDVNLNDESFNLEAYRKEQLDLHNHYRSLHGAQLMTRDEELTNQAQEFAETLATLDSGLQHCKDMDGCNVHGAGENLSTGKDATKAWYNEIWDYNFCYELSNNGRTRPGKEGKATGHFTQVVWDASTLLGIGYARSQANNLFVVARYKPTGNVGSNQQQYHQNVFIPSYILDTFQNNCDGVNGKFTPWSEPGECTRSCGGGVVLETRTCTSPKPSLNGADCEGTPSQLVPPNVWCNIQSCPGKKSYRDQQCQTRGYPPDSAIFNHPCKLYCLSGSGNVYTSVGIVDDGTHCHDGRGACVSEVCHRMPQYAAPTTPPPTNAQGNNEGSYTETPSSDLFKNIILSVPNGATNVVITNENYNDVSIYVGYTASNFKNAQFVEDSWMDNWVKLFGKYETTKVIAGVTFDYKRVAGHSTITIAGPVNPTPGYHFVLFAKGRSPADISWTYDI